MEELLDTSLGEYDILTYKPDKVCIIPPTKQTIEIDVTIKDLFHYWGNKPKIFPFSSKDYTPYNYSDPYENLEYYCNYNYLFIGLDVIKSLLNGKSKKLLISIYDYGKDKVLPHFIKGVKEYKSESFEYSFDEIQYTKIKKENFYIKNVEYISFLVQKTNICYDYFKHTKILPCYFCYDVDKKDFWATGSNYNEIIQFFNSFSTGIQKCLNIQINKKGELVKPLACNTRMLYSILYKVPSIPTNLCYTGGTNIFDNIKTTFYKEDLEYANKYFRGNLLFKGTP